MPPKVVAPPAEDPPASWDDDSDDDSSSESSSEASTEQESKAERDDASKTESNSDSETDSDAGFGEDDESQIFLAYKKLASRRVDLVGDYAGNELFLIEGDSLLLDCFSDVNLDFNTGFQMLHAVYNVERFLHSLAERKCNFHIAYFDTNKSICVPPSAKQENVARYYLARAAIIRHLQSNLAKTHPTIAVETFASYDAPEFAAYMIAQAPYFVMCHDGAISINGPNRNKTLESTPSQLDQGKSQVAPRQTILAFMAKGYNVALINGLECRDTKVMTMVLESRARKALSGLVTTKEAHPTNPSIDISSGYEELSKSHPKLSDREKLAVLVVKKIIQNPPPTIDPKAMPPLCATFLLHQALLTQIPLSARRVKSEKGIDGAQKFMTAVAHVAERMLESIKLSAQSDIIDFFDGRLFLSISEGHFSLDPETRAGLNTLLAAVETVSTANLPSESTGAAVSTADVSPESDLAVLPFSNPVFDKHLESVALDIDEHAGGEQTLASHKIFREATHWHNAKKPVIVKGPPTPQSLKQEFWAKKRNQLFMAEMTTYAASLTNAVGKSLEPESIIVGTAKASAPEIEKKGGKKVKETKTPAESDLSDSSVSTSKGKGGPKKGGGKNAAKSAVKQAMFNQLAASKAKKDEAAGDKIAASWRIVCKNIESDSDPRARYRKAKDFLANIKSDWKEVVGAEVELFMLSSLVQYWINACRDKEQSTRIEVTALIWNTARSITQSKSITKTIASNIELTAKTLGLPPIPNVATNDLPDRKLAFTFALPTKVDALSAKLPSKTFQLLYGGPYLERSFNSAPDSRVDFNPDGWQREVLDGIDRNESIFVVAPTSAGKTFISFYAMRKVLEADDDGVLVYVAPTKALVNQIAAEIQARYSKKFKYGGKSVWAIHTRDYRINNPTGCQVLVTVPHVLQIMLLAPSNANSWAPRVKRIIFDEVHSIGQAEDGVVWEQLLLLAPCPIIALSATVGNPDEFSGWLTSTQKAIGIDLKTVHHPHRYSDLRKYFYVPPKQFAFKGIPEPSAFGTLGLEGLKGFNYVHPVAALVDKTRGIPEDLALEALDCYHLWNAMTKYQTKDYPVPSSLSPDKALPDVSRKVDILAWEKRLKVLLKDWLSDPSSPYDSVLKELEKSFRTEDKEDLQTTLPKSDVEAMSWHVSRDDNLEALKTSTLPMLCRLNAQSALPAILFNYDRNGCEAICQTVVEQLRDAEMKQRKTGPKWAKTLERWEEWKKVQAKLASKKGKVGKKASNDDDEKTSKLDQQRDAGAEDISQWDSFDPDAPLEGYHFADHTRVQKSELEVFIRQLGRRNIQQWLIDAISRGVGVHHSGMNRKYRQVVEILFRKGFLRVIIATGTLALGINMPCKTVVFSGDSVFLTALNFRQCAGRAGRRGFDLLGNVVFQGVDRPKVCRLISSRLPSLNGHFPITTTLVLRLFTLLHESKNSKYAVSAINALLSQPRMHMGGASFKEQTMHHLRFSIEYLRRQQLLSAEGVTLNFAGMVSHLYFTENSSFAFHALLKEGYFHDLCADINKSEKKTLETLMLVMAHLFGRIQCRQADQEFRDKVAKPSSSLVFLPPMPKKAAAIMRQHNKETLDVYRTYVETFVDQHIAGEDCTLPLTGMLAGGDNQKAATKGLQSLPPTRVRSSFVALSGAGDDFATIHDLCQTTRSGVFLEEAVIPHLDVYPDEMNVPLNAWLLDFFKHGDVFTLERANGISRADVWFLLNDFSMVLATLITSLLNFMKLHDGSDMDMLEVMGDMDAHEEAEENKIAESEEQRSELSGPSVADSAISIPERGGPKVVSAKKAKNADSWEDVADEENKAIASEERRANTAARLEAEEQAEKGDGNNEGLRNVLKALQKLNVEFNSKFRAMWA
ncbi:Hypothetical protein R9X50_00604300 [Acrodontium crateriforme]|uniref:DEAD/DEAH box helicase n=1 Tax=Acrodontium crateriforme TaxID=150365 RepID=A0AAQ3MD09_9PEZI|nr:Hypothetical protein R9X50_00604300 [Acrodontium crateriforme]